jgi:hypothetical protein
MPGWALHGGRWVRLAHDGGIRCLAEMCVCVWTLRWHRRPRVRVFEKALVRPGALRLGGAGRLQWAVMVAPANVAPGLAACACADRPASFQRSSTDERGQAHD